MTSGRVFFVWERRYPALRFSLVSGRKTIQVKGHNSPLSLTKSCTKTSFSEAGKAQSYKVYILKFKSITIVSIPTNKTHKNDPAKKNHNVTVSNRGDSLSYFLTWNAPLGRNTGQVHTSAVFSSQSVHLSYFV